ncbi:MAG: arsenical-resistance protein [Pirellula sp.]|nr:arsenical-resistance protein [Pirellula sp.]
MPRLSTKLASLDRHLAALIGLAVAQGIAICICVPSAETFLESLHVGKVNVPIAVGLVAMMYPSMCAVRYESLATLVNNAPLLRLALFHHWLSGPFIMFSLAVLFLRHQPEYMAGLILIGLARGIGGVATWNKLAEGDEPLASGLAALNVVMQLAFYPLYAWFFIAVLPPMIGVEGSSADTTISQFAVCTSLYLGVPLAAGLLTRVVVIRLAGKAWYESTLLPRLMPLKTVSMLVTLVLIFSLKTDELLALPWQVLLIAVPLLLYYVAMFAISFYWNCKRGTSYARTATMALSAAGNNFELAIAIGVAVYGIDSAEAFTTVVAPFIEAPVMLAFVAAAWYFNRRLFARPEGAHMLPHHLSHLGQSKLDRKPARTPVR